MTTNEMGDVLLTPDPFGHGLVDSRLSTSTVITNFCSDSLVPVKLSIGYIH